MFAKVLVQEFPINKGWSLRFSHAYSMGIDEDSDQYLNLLLPLDTSTLTFWRL